MSEGRSNGSRADSQRMQIASVIIATLVVVWFVFSNRHRAVSAVLRTHTEPRNAVLTDSAPFFARANEITKDLLEMSLQLPIVLEFTLQAINLALYEGTPVHAVWDKAYAICRAQADCGTVTLLLHEKESSDHGRHFEIRVESESSAAYISQAGEAWPSVLSIELFLDKDEELTSFRLLADGQFHRTPELFQQILVKESVLRGAFATVDRNSAVWRPCTVRTYYGELQEPMWVSTIGESQELPYQLPSQSPEAEQVAVVLSNSAAAIGR